MTSATRGREAKRVAEIETALRFYANHHNHVGTGVSRVYVDGGRLARAAVGACGTCTGLGWVKTGGVFVDQDGPYEGIATCSTCRGSGVGS